MALMTSKLDALMPFGAKNPKEGVTLYVGANKMSTFKSVRNTFVKIFLQTLNF